MCTATMRICTCTEMHLLQQLRMWGQLGALWAVPDLHSQTRLAHLAVR